MQDRGYLLNVAGIDVTKARVWEKLDAERLKKLDAARTAQRQRACAGAGLLIQWALQEVLQLQETLQLREAQGVLGQDGQSDGRQEAIQQSGQGGGRKGVALQEWQWHQAQGAGASAGGFLRELALEELLSGLGEPLPVSYVYGGRSKPYFRDFPFFFNLSHSGDYVVCALSEREIGVDIQRRKPVDFMRIGRRFFHEREKDLLLGLSGEAERMEWFYRLWCRKEAYGKMTGDGIIGLADGIIGLADGMIGLADGITGLADGIINAAGSIYDAVAGDFSSLDAAWLQGTDWQEYGGLDGYQIACCGRKNNVRYGC